MEFSQAQVLKLIWPKHKEIGRQYEVGEAFPYGKWYLNFFEYKAPSFLANRAVVLAEFVNNTCTEEKGENGSVAYDTQMAVLTVVGKELVIESLPGVLPYSSKII